MTEHCPSNDVQLVCRGIPEQKKRTGMCPLDCDFVNTQPNAKHTVVLNTDLMNKIHCVCAPTFIQRLFSSEDR